MEKKLIKRNVIFVPFFLLIFSIFSLAQTEPQQFLGHMVGADRKLADYGQILAYFEKLDQESEKIKVIEIGKSTLGKPMIMAIITSEKNMENLDEYRQISKKLRDARDIEPEEAKQLARRGKVILLITCNIHATEIASSQMALEFAYNLASGNTPFDIDKVLEDVIVLLCPTINPDGQMMVTDWYRKYVGTRYEGGQMPWLYHHYAGHDNNRDWFMFNLKETQAVTKVLYHDWIPQIHIDEHQMGSTGARLFIPPFMNPPIPNVHPLCWRGVNLCGANMAYDLQKKGFKGVVHGRSYTGWWIGACDDTSWLHNCIGLLSEMASVKVATPIYIEPTEIPEAYYKKQMEFPDPWPGGWWKLRDLVDYELTLSMSLVKTAHLHKEDFLFNFYKMCKDSIEEGKKGKPFAFVIPKEQPDYPTTLRMLEILKFGGVEIYKAKKSFIADGKFYPADSFVVLMSQPYRAYAQALLEKQKYPDIRQYPGGPPVPPYDNAGWTLPLQMGVKCEQIENPFSAELESLENITYSFNLKELDSPYLVFDSRKNASFAVIFNLLKKGVEVRRARECLKSRGIDAAIGSFIIKNSPEIREHLKPLLEKWRVSCEGLDDISSISASTIRNPQIGLYQSWRANMDEGWTRYVLDDFGISYSTLHNEDFKVSKKEKKKLSERFDVLIFASERPEIIKTGKPSPESRYARYFTAMPPEYEGGIEKEGVEALREFVENGGILVTLNQACELILKEFEPPISNALEKVEQTKFFCPTSLLRIKVDNTNPVGYGLAEETAAMFSDSLAFSTWIPPSGDWERKVVASYPEENILLSGWLIGEDIIARKASVVDLKYKKGHFILIGFCSQHRAQSHGTYKFLFNSLLYPVEK